ncbi:Metallo-hydrolase/oxidoreductase, partial [Pseudovirgaria hyperparasitica]
MAASLPPLPEIERLSSRVIRILGGNPGKFTLQGTNTYLIGQGPKRILLDTGEGKPAWIQSIKSLLASENIQIDRAILTHWHADHVGGITDLRALSPHTLFYKNQPDPGQTNYTDGQTFKTDGATLRAFHCPGHTADHMAFILEEEDAMFTGDNVLGHGTAVFEDLAAYMDSLERMAGQFHGRAYPGHGPVIDDGRAKVLEYIAHRKQRENQIVEVLGREKEGAVVPSRWGSMEMVKVIYRDYPENLHEPAEKGVVQVLEKLARDGRVARDEASGAWSLLPKSTL